MGAAARADPADADGRADDEKTTPTPTPTPRLRLLPPPQIPAAFDPPPPLWPDRPRAAALRAVASRLRALTRGTSPARIESAARLRDAVAAAAPGVDARAARNHFWRLLPSRAKTRGAEGASRALLAFMCEREPRRTVEVIGRDPDAWRAFFDASDTRIKLWFSHFVPNAKHTRGARALANFALARREVAWRHIAWRGKHAQTPVVVANKLHYFCDVDVLETVRRVLYTGPRTTASAW